MLQPIPSHCFWGIVAIGATMLALPSGGFGASPAPPIDAATQSEILSAKNDRQFFSLLGTKLAEPGVRQRQKELLEAYASSQPPPGITKKELADVFSVRRQSIHSLRWKRVVTKSIEDTAIADFTEEHAVEGEKIWRKWRFTDSVSASRAQTTSSAEAGVREPQVLAYDGTLLRSCEWRSHEQPLGTLEAPKATPLRMFFTEYNLLPQALLTDSFKIPGLEDWANIDLVSLLMHDDTIVTREKAHGTTPEIIRVSSMIWTASLDPSRGYAVIELDGYNFGERIGGHYIAPALSYRRELSGYRAYGKDIWLPSTSHQYWYENGVVKDEKSVEYQNIQVNTPIPASLFTDIFPPKTYVKDFRKASVSAHPTTQNFEAIEAALAKASIPGERIGPGWIIYFVIAFGGASLLVLGVWLIIRHRRVREGK
jgi:hypothetical protein